MGDEVFTYARGFGGTPVKIYGRIVQHRGAPAVDISGTSGMLAAGSAQKRVVLTEGWTLVGEEHPADARGRDVEAKMKAKTDAMERRVADTEARVAKAREEGARTLAEEAPRAGMRVRDLRTGEKATVQSVDPKFGTEIIRDSGEATSAAGAELGSWEVLPDEPAAGAAATAGPQGEDAPGGDYCDLEGHCFPTPEALGGHIAATGHGINTDYLRDHFGKEAYYAYARGLLNPPVVSVEVPEAPDAFADVPPPRRTSDLVVQEARQAPKGWSPERLRVWVDNVPERHRGLVSAVRLMKEKHPEAPDVAGLAYYDRGRIDLFPLTYEGALGRVNDSVPFQEEALYHEVGHLVAGRLFGHSDPAEAAYPGWGVQEKNLLGGKDPEDPGSQNLRDWQRRYLEVLAYWWESAEHPEAERRPAERHGKKLTKAELKVVEPQYRAFFKQQYGEDFDALLALSPQEQGARLTKRVGPGMGVFTAAAEVAYIRRYMAEKDTPQRRLAKSYVKAARDDGKWVSDYAQAVGDHEGESHYVRRAQHRMMTENFAEAYAGWLTDSWHFRTQCPHRYAWMVQVFGKPPGPVKEAEHGAS